MMERCGEEEGREGKKKWGEELRNVVQFQESSRLVSEGSDRQITKSRVDQQP